MQKDTKIICITNFCTHYRKSLFEKLSDVYDAQFYFFSDGQERYWESRNRIDLGAFKGEYLPGFWFTKKIRITPSLIPLVLKTDADVVIKDIMGRFTLPVTFLLAKLRKLPFILWTGVWEHPRTFFHKVSFPFTKFIYKSSDAICVYGLHVKRYLVSLGVDEKKIFIVTQAVDNARYAKEISAQERDQLHQELDVRGRKVILFVAQIEERKGIYYLIDALEKLDQEKAVLILVGRGSQVDNVKRIVKEKGLNNVRFLNYIENELLYRYYAIADVFVLPSINTVDFREPWGLVINEAMNQGCPVVATDAVGAAAGELVQNGVNGFVVPEKNSARLFEALSRILSDDALRDSMRRESKNIIKNFTDEIRLQGFMDAVDFVLNKHKVKEKCLIDIKS